MVYFHPAEGSVAQCCSIERCGTVLQRCVRAELEGHNVRYLGDSEVDPMLRPLSCLNQLGKYLVVF